MGFEKTGWSNHGDYRSKPNPYLTHFLNGLTHIRPDPTWVAHKTTKEEQEEENKGKKREKYREVDRPKNHIIKPEDQIVPCKKKKNPLEVSNFMV